MQLSVLIGYMKDRLKKRRALVQSPHPSQDQHFYPNHLAQMSLGAFEEVIARLEKYIKDAASKGQTDLLINDVHINIIKDFFEFRWQLIKNTDESYFINTTGSVNLLCKDVAQFLAGDNHLAGNTNKNALLMPTVASWFNSASGHHLQDYYWHTMLCLDEASDGTHRVLELGCLYQPAYMDGRLVLRCKMDNDTIELSSDEVDRVVNHSAFTKAFYEDFLVKKRKNAAAEHNKKLADALFDGLRDINYYGQTVQSSYGEAGFARLRDNLLKNIDRMFTSRTQIVEYLALSISPSEWESLLEKMDAEVFFNLIVGGDANLDKEKRLSDFVAANGHTLVTKDQTANEAMFFCLVTAYWLARDENKNEFISLFGGWGCGWDRSSKQAEVEAIKKVLTHRDQYRDKTAREAFLNSDEKSAKNESTLGVIFKLMCSTLKEPKMEAAMTAVKKL